MIGLLEVLLPSIAAYVFIYFTSLGHSIVEKSGVLNLAIDGVFFMSCSVAVATSYVIYASIGESIVPAIAGTIVAAVASVAMGLLMSSILTIFPVNHGAFGLSLMFLGYGLGIVIGYPIRLEIGVIRPFTYPDTLEMYFAIFAISIATALIVHFLIEKTNLGAAIRAVGEKPHGAYAMGVNLLKVRLYAAIIGFFIMGIGGSMFTLFYTRMWGPRDYLLAYGWIAFTIALAAGRHPLLLVLFSMLFGGILGNRYVIQVTLGIPPDISYAIPYISALFAMLAYSFTKLKEVFAPPSALGRIFYKEERSI